MATDQARLLGQAHIPTNYTGTHLKGTEISSDLQQSVRSESSPKILLSHYLSEDAKADNNSLRLQTLACPSCQATLSWSHWQLKPSDPACSLSWEKPLALVNSRIFAVFKTSSWNSPLWDKFLSHGGIKMIPKTWDSVKPLCFKQLGHVLTFPICFWISIPNNSLSLQENVHTHFIYKNIPNIPSLSIFCLAGIFPSSLKKIFFHHLLTERG